jgi:hypothetical protein
LREAELAKVLESLTSEEVERVVLPLASQIDLSHVGALHEALLKARPKDSAPLLCKMFERFTAAGGKPSSKLRYFLHDVAATEHLQAADLLYGEWERARKNQDAEWQDTVLNALLAFRTPVAEDVTLKLLGLQDIHLRYRAVEQLGRIGTEKAHKAVSAMLRTEPDMEFGSGDILLRTHEILKRTLAEIEKRRRAPGK